jgi:hypothetical protein
MRKNLLKKYFVPALVITLVVLYVLYKYTNREGFQTSTNVFTSNNGANGAEGEVAIQKEGGTFGYLRLNYTTNGKCTVPNPNPNKFETYLYNPTRDFVSPTGKKICMTYRNYYTFNNPNGILSSTNGANGSQGEVALLRTGNSPTILRLQYTTNGVCTVPNPNPNGFISFLYNPTRDFVSPTGKKLCITIRGNI